MPQPAGCSGSCGSERAGPAAGCRHQPHGHGVPHLRGAAAHQEHAHQRHQDADSEQTAHEGGAQHQPGRGAAAAAQGAAAAAAAGPVRRAGRRQPGSGTGGGRRARDHRDSDDHGH